MKKIIRVDAEDTAANLGTNIVYVGGLAVVVTTTEAYHVLLDGSPAYGFRFRWAGNFNERTAPVKDRDGLAYHIKPDGMPLYSARFDDARSFYEGAAVAKLGEEMFHIGRNGEPLYSVRFKYVERFKMGMALVTDKENKIFHIDHAGHPIYDDRFDSGSGFDETTGTALVGKIGQATPIRLDVFGNHVVKLADLSR